GWPTPAGIFTNLADGRRITDTDNRNIAELSDPAVNTAMDDAFVADMSDSAVAADPSGTAAARWAAVERRVLDTAAYIPVTYDKVTNIYSSNLTNVYYQPAYDSVDFSALGVR
ncbi:ABC transporter substrate-binding protein, partial [Pseudofrankia sp. BMG5.37]|nr:ABC transporter substrate-binding protein [Pseudofrankia sp. BMG5.37]